MYDFNLFEDEEIILISDNTKILDKENYLYTSIITTKRILILDYPSKIHNSYEDLRSIGRINTVRMKEVIFEVKLSDIKDIQKFEDYQKISFGNKSIIISDNEITNKLKDIIK